MEVTNYCCVTVRYLASTSAQSSLLACLLVSLPPLASCALAGRQKGCPTTSKSLAGTVIDQGYAQTDRPRREAAVKTARETHRESQGELTRPPPRHRRDRPTRETPGPGRGHLSASTPSARQDDARRRLPLRGDGTAGGRTPRRATRSGRGSMGSGAVVSWNHGAGWFLFGF